MSSKRWKGDVWVSRILVALLYIWGAWGAFRLGGLPDVLTWFMAGLAVAACSTWVWCSGLPVKRKRLLVLAGGPPGATVLIVVAHPSAAATFFAFSVASVLLLTDLFCPNKSMRD